MAEQYLPLAEYSSKYKVSISTLRRRIKAEDISYLFEDGKYLIQDDPMSTHQRVHRPSPRKSEEAVVSAPFGDAGVVTESAPMFGIRNSSHGEPQPSPALGEEPVLAVANRLLTELKKAYSQILHEKEEQLLHMKEELLDLRLWCASSNQKTID